MLRDEGLIYTVQGRGSFVADVIGPGGQPIEAKQPRAGTGEGSASEEAALPGPLTGYSSGAVGWNSARKPPSTANAAKNNSVSNLLALPPGI